MFSESMEDVNMLNEMINMLGIENNDNIAIPTLFYKRHLLINIDYFHGSDMFKFLKDKFFETCPQYYCSYNGDIYIYVGDISNWLKEYKNINKKEKVYDTKRNY